jgi:hypothetical protein
MFIHARTLKGAIVVALALGTAPAGAQVPGAPVLQNAFANPGLAVAANFGGGSGQSYFGAAAGWGMGSGRLQISGAAGVHRSKSASRGAYGGRAAMTVWSSSGGSLGLSGFAGLGGAPRTREAGVVTNPAVMALPVGVSVGYRRAMGRTRGLSIYASPFYRWSRVDSVASVSSSGFAVSAGLDFAFTQSLGATIGGEFGKSTGSGRGSSTFGAALSFVPGRR